MLRQWNFEEETGGAGPGDAGFSAFFDDDDYDVVIGEEPQPPKTDEPPEGEPTREELEAQLAEMREREQARQLKSLENSALLEGLDKLTKSIQSPQPHQGPAPKPFDQEAFRKEINEGYLEDPAGTLDKYFAVKIAPEVQRLAQSNLVNSRRFLELDPKRRETYDQFRVEIEAEMERVDPYTKMSDPDVYTRVHDVVLSRHSQEVIDKKVKEAVEAALAERGAAPTAGPRKPAPFSEHSSVAPGGGTPAQPAGKKTVYVPPEIARAAKARGVSPVTYYMALKRTGRIK